MRLIPICRKYEAKKPLLAVCYGAQYLAHFVGGNVAPSNIREYGRGSFLSYMKDEELFLEGIPSEVKFG